MPNLDIKLNSAQQEAVDTIDGPVLVLAGPGTGKTQLLSARVANILTKTDTPANSILCLTFTEIGAGNMLERLTSFIGQDAYQVNINTYHGFSQTIINQNRDYFANQNLDKVVDFITQHNLIREIQAELPVNNILKKINPRDIISTIGELKQALISPSNLLKLADENKQQIEAINKRLAVILADFGRMPGYNKAVVYFEQIQTALSELAPQKSVLEDFSPLLQIALRELNKALVEARADEKGSTKPLTAWKNDFLTKDEKNNFVLGDGWNDLRLRALQYIYEQYNQKMSELGLYDFDDMILRTIDTIEKNQDLKFTLQEKYLYILLDEYQDTNRAQSRLIELLTDNPVHEGQPNVMAVGDDDQAIYAFQGALYSNMIDFYNTYHDTKIINLTKNYRSHPDILLVAQNIAQQIDDRLINNLEQQGLTKDITAANPNVKECQITRLDYANPLAEYAGVAQKIKDLVDAGEDPNEIAVLSTRHHHLESLAPYLAEHELSIRYEKSQNVLDNPGVKLMLSLAKLINAIAERQPHNDLMVEVLSHPIWQLDTPVLWQLAWQAGNRQSWLEFILKNDQFSELRPLVYWLMEFAKIAPATSLEANFDYLIGNTAIEYQVDNKTDNFTSPIKDYYQQGRPDKLIDFVLDINLLREHYLAYSANHTENKNPLQCLVQLVANYEEADEKMTRTNSYNEHAQSVNLMTVYSAKGLEFKHVFVLETNDNTWGKSRSNSNRVALPDNLQPIRHDHETLDEKARLLFVAITRAKSHLYLVNSLASLTNRANTRLRFMKEIETKDGWRAESLPESSAAIRQVEDELTYSELDNNLLDNFSDWRDRHIKAVPKLQDLLEPRLAKYKLSATSFNNYTDLIYNGPKKYFLNHVLGFPGSYSTAALYGIGIHFALDSLQKSSEPATPELAMKLFRQKLYEFDLSEADFNDLVSRAENSLPKFVEARAELFQTQDGIKVETENNYYSHHVVWQDVRLTGTIDRLEINPKAKEITIVDFKTGKSFRQFDNSNAALYHHRKQLYFYKLMLEASQRFVGYCVKDWRLEFVDPDGAGEINFIAQDFDDVEVERINQFIKAIWQKTMALDFTEPEFAPGKQIGLSDIKKFEQSLLEERR